MRRRGIVAAAGVAAAVIGIAAGTRMRRFEIVNQSMHPALHEGDWVVAGRRRGPPRRGDVVVFEHDDRPGLTLVKRVIGLPGETVEIGNGQVHIDGAVLAEPWASGFTQPAGSWPVPEGTVFVLGDHRMAAGGDSRTLGGVPVSDVGWTVLARYWPPSRVGPIAST